MQVQNQTQQISEEEFLLPLSEDELASIAGGDPPRRSCSSLIPDPKPGEARIVSSAEVAAYRRCVAAQPRRLNPLEQRRTELMILRRRGPRFY